jgi:PST family polysaccharide transporter
MSNNTDASHNLGQRALAGMGWEALTRVGLQVIQLGVSIALARLLTPNDYGLVGMAAVYIILFQFVGELGLSGAVVQRKDITETQLNSIFWLNLPITLILALFAAWLAPAVSSFYGNPAVGPLFVGAAVSTLVLVPAMVPRAILYKNLQFKKIFYFSLASVVIGGAAGIGAALLNFGPWSLIISSFVTSLVKAVLIWYFCAWRPRLVFAPRSLSNLTSFSVFYLSDQVFRQISTNVDYLLIGYLFVAADLGLYTLAFRLMDLPRTQINMVFLSVLYPVLIKVQDDRARTNAILFRILQGSTLLVFPLLFGLGMVADDFINLFYGEKWSAAIPILQALVFTGILSCIDFAAPTLLLSQGRANLSFVMSVVRAVSLAAFILFASSAGIVAVATAVSVHAAFMLIVSLTTMVVLMRFNLLHLFRLLLPAVCASLTMVLVLNLAKATLILPNQHVFMRLITQVALGGLTYVAVLMLWPTDEVRALAQAVQQRVGFLRQSKVVDAFLLTWGRLGKRSVI